MPNKDQKDIDSSISSTDSFKSSVTGVLKRLAGRDSPQGVIELEEVLLNAPLAAAVQKVHENFEQGKPSLLLANYFDFSAQQSTGGVTGSMRVAMHQHPDEGSKQYYQYKTTIKKASVQRQIKTLRLDRENFGEVIASKIAMASLNSKSDKNNAPSVHLVYDKPHKSVNVASRYLVNVQSTLDGYLTESCRLDQSGRKHIVIVSEHSDKKHSNGVISTDHPSITPLKSSLAEAIAISVLIGDHDVNPGNMMVVLDPDRNAKVVRIDFGHALNDLLNAPERFGGGITDNTHPVLDFLNREHVAGVPKPASSKLWRDYPGLILTQEFHDALLKVSHNAIEQMDEGISNAIAEYEALINKLHEEKDYSSIEHVLSSLSVMHNNFTGQTISQPSRRKFSQNVGEARSFIYQCMHDIAERCRENASDMQYAAKLLEYQLLVDELIKLEFYGETTNEDVALKHQKLAQFKISLGGDVDIKWIKTDESQLALECNCDQYYEERRRMLLPKLEIDHTKTQAISVCQNFLNARLMLEKTLLDKGMDPIDIQNIYQNTPSDPKFPEIEQIKDLTKQIVHANRAIEHAFFGERNIAIQWGSSQIEMNGQIETFGAFKGSAIEYLEHWREQLHLLENVTEHNNTMDDSGPRI